MIWLFQMLIWQQMFRFADDANGFRYFVLFYFYVGIPFKKFAWLITTKNLVSFTLVIGSRLIVTGISLIFKLVYVFSSHTATGSALSARNESNDMWSANVSICTIINTIYPSARMQFNRLFWQELVCGTGSGSESTKLSEKAEPTFNDLVP